MLRKHIERNYHLGISNVKHGNKFVNHIQCPHYYSHGSTLRFMADNSEAAVNITMNQNSFQNKLEPFSIMKKLK